jgi:hypothetical protein
MKEVSIEEKARAYDEALERVKELLSRCRNNRDRITMVYRVNDIESIFPELKKSEDEKIKEDLIQWISDFPDMIWSGHYKKDVIAWLEKQGEQKQDVNVQINPSEYVNDMGGNGCYLKNATQTSTCSKKEEKVDNQNCVKSVDDIKPKFKVGDWIVFDNGNVEHITSVGTHGYTFDDGDYLLHDECDKIAHLWSIQDARDGDVLANDHHILILKELVYDWSSNGTSYSVKAYCGIKPNGNFEIGKDNWSFCGTLHIHPATKEQRDTLFAKMKEAKWEWDAEKKELWC